MVDESQRSSMPPRCTPRAYRSSSASLSRRPGCRNARGTQVGARRRIPSPRSTAARACFSIPACGISDTHHYTAHGEGTRSWITMDFMELHRDECMPLPTTSGSAQDNGRMLCRIAGVLDALQCGALLVDRGGRMTHVNHKLCEMMQRAPAELIGRTLFDVYR